MPLRNLPDRRLPLRWFAPEAHFPHCAQGCLAVVIVEALYQQRTIEMIQFVLEQTGLEFVGLDGHLIAFEVTAHDVHLLGTDDLPEQSWNRQAALLEHPLTIGFADLGVDDGTESITQIPHEQAFLDSNLRTGKADAARFVHRFRHASDDPPQSTVDVGHLTRPLAKHWIADNANFIGRHGSSGYLHSMADQHSTNRHPAANRHPDRHSTNRHPDHYFSAEPYTISQPMPLDVDVGDVQLQLTTDRGVFSYGRLDPGTKLLLMEAPPVSDIDCRVLDLGCGWGPIACVTARRAPHTQVTAVDVNERALRLTVQNATSAGLANVTIAHPDDVDAGMRFHRILCNPPIRIGKPALHELLTTWLDRLEPEGQAHLVVNRHLGSDSLARWLTGRGHRTRRLLSRKGYRILEVAPRPQHPQHPEETPRPTDEPIAHAMPSGHPRPAISRTRQEVRTAAGTHAMPSGHPQPAISDTGLLADESATPALLSGNAASRTGAL